MVSRKSTIPRRRNKKSVSKKRKRHSSKKQKKHGKTKRKSTSKRKSKRKSTKKMRGGGGVIYKSLPLDVLIDSYYKLLSVIGNQNYDNLQELDKCKAIIIEKCTFNIDNAIKLFTLLLDNINYSKTNMNQHILFQELCPIIFNHHCQNNIENAIKVFTLLQQYKLSDKVNDKEHKKLLQDLKKIIVQKYCAKEKNKLDDWISCPEQQDDEYINTITDDIMDWIIDDF